MGLICVPCQYINKAFDREKTEWPNWFVRPIFRDQIDQFQIHGPFWLDGSILKTIVIKIRKWNCRVLFSSPDMVSVSNYHDLSQSCNGQTCIPHLIPSNTYVVNYYASNMQQINGGYWENNQTWFTLLEDLIQTD